MRPNPTIPSVEPVSSSPRKLSAHEERHSRYRLSHVETTAHGSGHAWRLSGRKIAVSAGGAANAFIVPARVGGDVDDAAGIGLFLVSPGQPGVEVHPYPTQDGASEGGSRRAECLAFRVWCFAGT